MADRVGHVNPNVAKLRRLVTSACLTICKQIVVCEIVLQPLRG